MNKKRPAFADDVLLINVLENKNIALPLVVSESAV